MRTSLLKRISAGFMAVATAATLWVGVGAVAVPTTEVYGGFTIQSASFTDASSANAVTAITNITGDTTTSTIGIPVANADGMDTGDIITIVAKYTPAAKKYLAAVTGVQATSLVSAVDPATLTEANNFDAAAAYDGSAQTVTFTMTSAANDVVATGASAFIKLGSTAYDLETLPSSAYAGFKVTGLTVGAETAATKLHGNITAGIIEIPVTADLAAGKKVTINTSYTAATGKYLDTITATQVSSITGGAIGAGANIDITNDYAKVDSPLASTEEFKISDLAAAKTVNFTLTVQAGKTVTAGSKLYVQFAATETSYSAADTEFAFWSSITGRRAIPAVNVNKTDKKIVIDYTMSAPADLWKFTSDKLNETLPMITIGQAKTLTSFTGEISTDYYTATISGKDGKVKLNDVEYAVEFKVSAIPTVAAATLTDAAMKKAMAYTQTLSIGGADYTYNKDTDYTGLIDATTLTFQKVTTLTGTGTVTFKGAYLYADQSFTVTAADLKDGRTIQLVYKDGTTSNVTVKATGTGIAKPSTTFFGSALQTNTDAIGDNMKRYTTLVDSAKSTTYPTTIDISKKGMDIINISLVNDVIPATMQIKVESKVIAGGSKTVDIDFYNQVFPIELTDGSFYYLSVNLSSLKNNLIPVTKFDFIGAASSNINLIPLMTWDQSKQDTNKILYIDYCGTLTDRVTYSGVLADGTTDKIFPSTSYYQPNTAYDSANWFYARWTEGDTLKGVSVKHTRTTMTFDIKDPTTGTMVTYVAVMINSKQAIDATATNSTLGGQCEVKVDTGEYTQKWKQADAYTQWTKDGDPVRTKGKISITSYYTGTIDLDADYVVLTLRMPKGAKFSLDTAGGDIKGYEELQVYEGAAGNTTPDGLVDYVVKLMYREIYTGSNNVGTSTLHVEYPMTNKDNKASTTAYKDYVISTTWTAKSYIAEKKVTMAGITVPSAIVAPPESSSAASSVAASSTAASSVAASSAASSVPYNPDTGVPFNTLAYVVTIAASAIGGVSTMVLRKK